jgi:hypothetical protein
VDELESTYREIGELEIIRRTQKARITEMQTEIQALHGLRQDDIVSFNARIEALERISADKALTLVEQEIAWSKEHKGESAESIDFEKGFIKGLEQAKFFINKILHQV